MLNDPFAVVKECKGAALALLVLLSVNAQRGGGAVTQEWLERHSGYSDKPVSQALVYLRETGRIVETAAGYALAEGSIWAAGNGAPQSLESEQRSSPSADFTTSDAQDRQESHPAPTLAPREARPRRSRSASRAASTARKAGASRKISDSPTTTAALKTESIQEAEEEAGIARESGNEILPAREAEPHIDLARVEANLMAFRKWGVGRNQKTIVIAARPDVTPEQIEAIARQLIAERRFSTGLLVTAVQSGDQPVANLPNKYAPRDGRRDPAGYASWEE